VWREIWSSYISFSDDWGIHSPAGASLPSISVEYKPLGALP
jgi:hypothetical protein